MEILDFFRYLTFKQKAFAILIVFLSLGAIIAVIRLLPKTKIPLPYTEADEKIGHYGPAGGIVFYDKGYYSDGWRYLEAAPRETEFVAVWGTYGIETGAKYVAVGSGKQNTDIIVNCVKQAVENSGTAAQLCENLIFNEYKDWFLPSADELRLMYENLKAKRLGGFRNALYYSSTETSKFRAIHFCFGFWADNHLYDKTYRFCIQPIERFDKPTRKSSAK